MTSPKITAHMIVKNEDQWVYYAIQSVLPYVEQLLITDTGSSDNTLSIIKSIESSKIQLTQITLTDQSDLTGARNAQIKSTKTDWIWLVDGDEIYTSSCAQEVVEAVKSAKYKCITLRRNDLLGDVYHRQLESIGEYKIFGEKGHLVTRLFNQKLLTDLEVKGDYPLEEYLYLGDKSTSELPRSDVYITSSYLYHAMYLKRSSLGARLTNVFNRSKYKIELGIEPSGRLPEVDGGNRHLDGE